MHGGGSAARAPLADVRAEVLASERLRPEWSEHWIANPKRMFAYTPIMPQNFENDPDPKVWKWQQQFVGTPKQQSQAVKFNMKMPVKASRSFLSAG